MKIETDAKGMVIALLIVTIVVMAIYKYRDFTHRQAIEMLNYKITIGQQAIGQGSYNKEGRELLRRVGWSVGEPKNNQQPDK